MAHRWSSVFCSALLLTQSSTAVCTCRCGRLQKSVNTRCCRFHTWQIWLTSFCCYRLLACYGDVCFWLGGGILRATVIFWGLPRWARGGLIFVHYISMGGRDWDLMAFPGLFYSLWGFLCLGISPRREAYFRQVRWSVLPLMTMHTALWVGINHDTARAMDRLGNLLEYTPNQSLNYQYFVKGHYYLNLRQDNPERAEVYLRKAIAHTPDDDSGTLRRYRKYLGQTLVLRGDFVGAIAQFEKAFADQRHPLMQQFDKVFHAAWVTALIEEGLLQRLRGREAAEALWEEAIGHCRRILAIQPSASLFRLLGRGLLAMEQFDEASAAYYGGIELEGSTKKRASA